MEPPEELEGLQWGKSGLEMDEERKKQVCDENQNLEIIGDLRNKAVHENNSFMSH